MCFKAFPTNQLDEIGSVLYKLAKKVGYVDQVDQFDQVGQFDQVS